MTPESVFSAASTTALVAWLLLIVRPRARWVRPSPHLVRSPADYAVPSRHLGRGRATSTACRRGGALRSGIRGRLHYLVRPADRRLGTRDAAKRGIPHWMVIPCLLLTFMLGPAGWLLYQGVRKLRSA
jgi:hypothetical protein